MKLTPVLFRRMCCGAGWFAGQAANGDVYWRRVTWLASTPWGFAPAPTMPVRTGPETKRRSHSVKTGRNRAARPARRR